MNEPETCQEAFIKAWAKRGVFINVCDRCGQITERSLPRTNIQKFYKVCESCLDDLRTESDYRDYE